MRLLLAFAFATLCFAAGPDKDLTFHATFDNGTDAKVARGDKRLFSGPSYKEQVSAQPGLGAAPDVQIAKGKGRTGDALRFTRKNTKAVFYKAPRNVAFDPANWSGTISFWLNLDPDIDLEPGFCDPIQVTDKAYNDSAIWVDFTKDDKPRHFRLGVFGALKTWNPENLPADKFPAFNNRLVVVRKTPFARGKWTHVAITFWNLGKDGNARLYLDGALQGETEIVRENFDWELEKGAIRLGVNYVGLMDDVMIYRRPLTAQEIAALSKGKF